MAWSLGLGARAAGLTLGPRRMLRRAAGGTGESLRGSKEGPVDWRSGDLRNWDH